MHLWKTKCGTADIWWSDACLQQQDDGCATDMNYSFSDTQLG